MFKHFTDIGLTDKCHLVVALRIAQIKQTNLIDMTPDVYFLNLKTLDNILLILNINVADDAFYKKKIYFCNSKITFNMKDCSFSTVKMTERRNNQSEEWTLFTL